MPKKYSFVLSLLCVSSLAFAQDDQIRWNKWETQADTLMNHEQHAPAAELYTKIINESKLKEKADFKVLYKRAVCYYRTEELEKSLTDLNRFIPEFPENPKPRILRALIYRQKGDLENQLSDLQKAIEIRGPIPELLRWRGTLLSEKGEFQMAKKDLLTVAVLIDDAEIETNLGIVYYSLGKSDSALMRLNKAIVLDVNYPNSYLYAGTFCLQDENYELALKYLNLALRVDPDNHPALFYKGVSLVELNKTDEGCRCLRKAFAAGEDDATDYLKEFCFDVFK
jgi:tetratricopeptide (TPR) repeat protein